VVPSAASGRLDANAASTILIHQQRSAIEKKTVIGEAGRCEPRTEKHRSKVESTCSIADSSRGIAIRTVVRENISYFIPAQINHTGEVVAKPLLLGR
jgi:hypothetical protein